MKIHYKLGDSGPQWADRYQLAITHPDGTFCGLTWALGEDATSPGGVCVFTEWPHTGPGHRWISPRDLPKGYPHTTRKGIARILRQLKKETAESGFYCGLDLPAVGHSLETA